MCIAVFVENHSLLVTLHTDTVDGSLVTASVPVLDGYGWTRFTALAQKQVSHSVDTAAGALTTVDIMKTSLFRAPGVLLKTVCSSKHCMACLSVDIMQTFRMDRISIRSDSSTWSLCVKYTLIVRITGLNILKLR